MKTISTLLASFLLTTSGFAAGLRPTASLTIKTADRSPIVVVVDGKCFDLGSSSIMINNLEPTYHDVKVYQQTFNGPVDLRGKECDVLFNSSVLLKPRTSLLIAIDDCGIITMNETRSRTPRIGDDWQPGRYDYPPVTGGIYTKAISNNEFDRVLWAISKESFETNKMRSAEQIISTNYFTTTQLKQLLRLFNFESNKLQLAKLGYDKVVDQSNYYTLSDMFSFNSSRDELARCIRK
jgi:Domain of unknown function (DUF4476)